MQESECPKCGGVMTNGFIVDRSYGGKYQQTWVKGQPETSFWTVLKTEGKEAYTVEAFRCVVCNYLEFYTSEEINIR